jgi:tetracycline 7-halogenase / FADH2 O2-dependent halogenase
MKNSFDIVVVGSGIAGSALALAASQAGLKTLVVERKSHPRFVIGESTLPTTTFLLNQIAADYGVPELAQIAHYLGLREHKLGAWPKQGFWFGRHYAGRPLDPRHEHMFETLTLPNGPDVHMVRADADGFLVTLLPKYGVEYLEHTEMLDCAVSGSSLRVRLKGPDGERDVSANFIVDASGHASFFAKRHQLRDGVPRLHTNTRSMFSHFKNVPLFDELLGGCNPSFRFRRDATTMHHCIPGGWIWVIPFDNGLTSVGIQLDRRQHPLDESRSPQSEIASILERHPSIAAHLGNMEPVFPIIRTDRVQFTASSILGPGFILTPHASGFIEPLFSTGVLMTAAFISRFVPLAQRAKTTGDWDSEQFRPMERLFFTELEQVDRLVDGAIQSFRDYDLWKQFWRNWIIGTVTQFASCVLSGHAPRTRPFLYGSGIDGFRDHLKAVHELVCRPPGDEIAISAEIKARTEPWWQKLTQPVLWMSGDWSVGASTGTGVHGANHPDTTTGWLRRLADDLRPFAPEADFANAERWLSATGDKMQRQLARYHQSKTDGTDYHRAYERILNNHNPARFDYYENVGLRLR